MSTANSSLTTWWSTVARLTPLVVCAALLIGCSDDSSDDECSEDYDCQQDGFTEAVCRDGSCHQTDPSCDETRCDPGCTDGCFLDAGADADTSGDADTSEDANTADADAGDADAPSVDADDLDPATACTASGGSVVTSSCCASTGPFPDLCSDGACGCAPDSSLDIQVCECGEGRCFDGTACVGLGD